MQYMQICRVMSADLPACLFPISSYTKTWSTKVPFGTPFKNVIKDLDCGDNVNPLNILKAVESSQMNLRIGK